MKLLKFIYFLPVIFLFGCGDVRGPNYENSDIDTGISHTDSDIFPHADNWNEPTNHGKFVIDNGSSACANSCHGENLEGGSARACKTCHGAFPHDSADIWAGISGHGKYAVDNGGAANCATACHGTDFNGGYDPHVKKSCTLCHSSFPTAHENGDWSGADHGQFISDVGNSNECSTMCHRADAPEEVRAKQCSICHENFPHQSDWRGNHGTVFSGKFTSGSANADCWLCHGSSIAFTTNQRTYDLTDRGDCYRCHFSYPHISFGGAGLSHVDYINSARLFTTNLGYRPEQEHAEWGLGNPWARAALASCSKKTGCHVDGRMSHSLELSGDSIVRCAGYCHRPE